MLEKPNLTDETIIACLRDSYGLAVTSLDFLPIGNDATAWVYRVDVKGGGRYFLKVKRGPAYVPSLLVPRYLKDQGIEQIVAPLPTQAQDLWQSLPGFSLILYPFIEGCIGMEIGLSERQWQELGAILKRIHSTQLPVGLAGQIRKENFVPKWSELVRNLQAQIKGRDYEDPFQRELAAFWREKAEEIEWIVARAEALGCRLQNNHSDFVLCHADIHTANILLDQAAKLFIVDWDDTLLAPIERDLMHVVDGPIAGFQVVTREEELFFEGYGPTEVDPVALAYYRYEWVVQEFGDYGERVFLREDVGEETKQDSVQGFIALFQPGDVVEAAYNSE